MDLAYAAALVVTVAAILYAGLVPAELHPGNDVTWIDPGPGLRFGSPAIAYTDGELWWEDPGAAAALSVELWIEPNDEPDSGLGQIFSFFDGGATEPFLIAQWKSGLVVRDRVMKRRGRAYRELGALGLLPRHRLRFVAVTSGPDGTAIFLDGEETEHRSNVPVISPGERFGGRVVLGNASTGRQQWNGDLLGAAIYRRSLGPEEIARHHRQAGETGVASLAAEAGLVALYAFEQSERGSTRSRPAPGPPLRVPLEFRRLRVPVLQLPDLRRLASVAHLRDAAVNLLGFVPLGFLLVAVARRRGSVPAGALIAGVALLGAALSLGIELCQVYFPTRVSSAADVGSNALGTALGAWLAVRGPIAARVFGAG